MEYTKKYRLAKIRTENNNGIFDIVFRDNEEKGYYGQGYYAAEEIFDSEDEAIEFAIHSSDWMHSEFTIIPIYEKINS